MDRQFASLIFGMAVLTAAGLMAVFDTWSHYQLSSFEVLQATGPQTMYVARTQ